MRLFSAVSRAISALTLMLGLFVLPAQAQDAKTFSNEQLDQLTAQIALDHAGPDRQDRRRVAVRHQACPMRCRRIWMST